MTPFSPKYPPIRPMFSRSQGQIAPTFSSFYNFVKYITRIEIEKLGVFQIGEAGISGKSCVHILQIEVVG